MHFASTIGASSGVNSLFPFAHNIGEPLGGGQRPWGMKRFCGTSAYTLLVLLEYFQSSCCRSWVALKMLHVSVLLACA